MRLAFDQVSFTYDAQLARAEKKRLRKLQKMQKQGKALGTSDAPATGAAPAVRETSAAPGTAAAGTTPVAGTAAAGTAPSASDTSSSGTAPAVGTTPVAGTAPSTTATHADATTPSSHSTWGNNPTNPWALQDITFSIEQGDFVGIAGHTGSGKSTLLQHLCGLLEPTSGTVLFNNAPLTSKTARQTCRAAVGVVFQYPERQLFAATVFDDVAFGPRNLKLSEQEVTQRVHSSLEAVGLNPPDIAHKSPFELSGGQQRRVAFAGVLAMNPSILVLDEPTAGLDPHAKASLLQLIVNLHAQGITIVMASHNMDDLAQLCTKIIVLNQGTLVSKGSPEQVFSHEKELYAIGLDVPAAQKMALLLRARGVALPQTLYTNAHDLAQDCAALYTQKQQQTAGKIACAHTTGQKQAAAPTTQEPAPAPSPSPLSQTATGAKEIE